MNLVFLQLTFYSYQNCRLWGYIIQNYKLFSTKNFQKFHINVDKHSPLRGL